MTSESMVDAIQDRKKNEKNAFKNIHNYKIKLANRTWKASESKRFSLKISTPPVKKFQRHVPRW